MFKANSNSTLFPAVSRALRAVLAASLLLPVAAFAQVRPEGRGGDLRPVRSLPSAEKRWALIIGVGDYEDANITPLPGANNDAKALRDALRDYAGFDEKQIILLTTDETRDRRPTKNNILRFLGNLSGTVRKDGLLLVAFSGHGIERQNRAFLLASDTPYNDNVKVLERTALSVQHDVRELIRDTGVGQVLILLDACRNDPASGRSNSDNPLTEAYKNGFSFDTRNREVEAFATLYATSIGERAYEYAREGKGYFTWAFVEGLKGGAADAGGEVTLGALVRYVEKYVPQQVKIDLGGNKVQRPFSIIEGYRAEELVVGVAKHNVAIPRPAAPLAPRAGEHAYWQEMEKRNTVAAYESYLSEYPDGEFTRVAKLRLGNLKWENFKPTAQKLLRYKSVWRFSEGLAVAYIEGDWNFAFVDKAGNQVFKITDYQVDSFSEGLARVNSNAGDNTKYGYVDKTGKEVIPLQYESLSRGFSEGLAAVRLNGKFGYIDKTGKEVIPFKYDCGFCGFSESLAPVRLLGSWAYGFIDRTDKVVIPFKYDFAFDFSEGLAGVELDERYGFVDRSGKEVIPIKYEKATRFSGGLACVRLNGKWGFIDKAGREVIQFRYDEAAEFSEGLAPVKLSGKWGFVDRAGRESGAFKYDYATTLKDGLAEVGVGERSDAKKGFVDKTGREVVPPKYDEVWCEGFKAEGFIGVLLNGKKGFVDVYGNEYFDLGESEVRVERAVPISRPSSASPALRASAAGFTFELESCARSGGDVLCRLTVSNDSGGNRQFNLCHADYRARRRGLDVTRAWDDSGKDYSLAESFVGAKRWAQSSYNEAVLPPRVPAALSLRFANVPAESTSFTLLRIAVAEQTNMLRLSYADFKNVPIKR